jgi:hypothetical protein
MQVFRCYINLMKPAERYYIEVKHRWSVPKRYTWEVHDYTKVLPLFESRIGFDSWEEASLAGKSALIAFQALSDRERKSSI